jgi:acetyltransferase-like isoleucine patch superfamily enzyme
MMNKFKILLRFPIDLWQMVVSHVPGSVGHLMRYIFWKKRLKFLGNKVKIDVGAYFQNPRFISIDDNCWIDRNVIILAGADKSSRPRRSIPNDDFPLEKGMVHIGKKVHVAPYSIISGIGGVYISDDCGIASGTKMYSFSNHYRSDEFPSDHSFCFALFVEHSRQYMIEGPIFLGENVGVASNAVILPGVSIEKDSFVAVNSVVMSSFGENSLIAGTPAKRIKERFENG